MDGIGIILFNLFVGELVLLSFGFVLRFLIAFTGLIGTSELHIPLAYGSFLGARS